MKDHLIIMESIFFLLVGVVVVAASSEDPMQGNFVYTFPSIYNHQIVSAEHDCC